MRSCRYSIVVCCSSYNSSCIYTINWLGVDVEKCLFLAYRSKPREPFSTFWRIRRSKNPENLTFWHFYSQTFDILTFLLPNFWRFEIVLDMTIEIWTFARPKRNLENLRYALSCSSWQELGFGVIWMCHLSFWLHNILNGYLCRILWNLWMLRNLFHFIPRRYFTHMDRFTVCR